jgi:2-polyprenyl-6-methoxyphenol hydroxylase-like FAD-dependent oxidoreductase
MDESQTYDVALVGYGPVGAALAILLGQHGHRVVVLERYRQPYPLPRAVHYDHEVARILQSCGVAEECSKIVEPAEVYEFRNAKGETLIRFGRIGNGLSGWPQSSMFSQPELEAILFRRAECLPSVEVRRGCLVTGLDDEGDTVVVHTDSAPVRARYVVGCDGANSTVRSLTGISMNDRAFFYDWLVVDVVFDEPHVFDPPNVQICDPVRPTTVVSGGPGRRRWEFMALPEESIDELNQEATAWRLLEPFDARPDNARLEKHAVYRFQARWAEDWRRGHVLLAGDAAHQTPPFAGQGLCAGIRDAANLSWKLDLVLRGVASDALLDSYGRERGPHARAVIELAIEMGKLICVADAEEAAARDVSFMSGYDGGLTDVPSFPPFTDGIVLAGSPHAGHLFVQGDVQHGGRRVRFDDAFGAGWRLVTLGPTLADPELHEWFTALGGSVVSLAGARADALDVDGTYGKWCADHGVIAALQRPDFVLFGTAAQASEVPTLVRALKSALTST